MESGATPGTENKYNPKGKHRPAFAGVSIAPSTAMHTGTLGCILRDKSNNLYILGSNSVLTRMNEISIGTSIIQPAMMDGGSGSDKIATLSNYIRLNLNGTNTVDAAIATVTDPGLVDTALPEVGKLQGAGEPKVGMKVGKFGRTTGYTTGVILSTAATVKIQYLSNQLEFINQIEITGDDGKEFASSGDSGSVIFDLETKKAIGLLSMIIRGSSFASPMNTVLESFRMQGLDLTIV
jgi:hypothetical protein